MMRRGRRNPRSRTSRSSTRRIRVRQGHDPVAATSNSDTGSAPLRGDDQVIVIEDDDDDCMTIDLTTDESPFPSARHHIVDDVIDLTSPTPDLPVVVGRPGLPRRSPRNHLTDLNRMVSLSDSDSDELPEIGLLSFNSPKTPEKSKAPSPASTSSRTLPQESPTSQMLTCPVCLDDYKAIRASNRQLYSTICGHIFCNECIESAIKAQHRCPTCRNKLNLSKTHPLFLG